MKLIYLLQEHIQGGGVFEWQEGIFEDVPEELGGKKICMHILYRLTVQLHPFITAKLRVENVSRILFKVSTKNEATAHLHSFFIHVMHELVDKPCCNLFLALLDLAAYPQEYFSGCLSSFWFHYQAFSSRVRFILFMNEEFLFQIAWELPECLT